MSVDWREVKNDYISGGGSLRKLAEKYGLSASSLLQVAAREKWSDEKKKQLIEIESRTKQETADIIVKKNVERVERLMGIHDQLLDKIEQAVKELNMTQATNKKKTRVIEYNNGNRHDKPTKETVTEKEEIVAVSSIVDRKGLQQIAVALKALWDISGEHEANKEDDYEDDGLLAALGSNAAAVFVDGDDSGMLPKEKSE